MDFLTYLFLHFGAALLLAVSWNTSTSLDTAAHDFLFRDE